MTKAVFSRGVGLGWRNAVLACVTPVLLTLAGCSPAPTATPVPPSVTPTPLPPTATPVPSSTGHVAIPTSGASWSYVTIGDSSLWGFPKFYAEYIEADLGVKVTILDWSGGYMSTAQALSQLRDNKLLRLQVSQAEVVMYRGNPLNYVMRIGTGSDNDKYDCSPQAVSAYKAEHKAVIAEIFSLRKGLPTIIRVYNLQTPWYRLWKEWGKYDEYRGCVAAFNAAIQQAAQEHGVPMADVHLAFNGPNDDEDPNDKGYLYDGVHENDMGSKVMADVFRKLGYAYIIP